MTMRAWTWCMLETSRLREKLQRDENGLTTTEWALLVAGVAALAIVVVAVVRNLTSDVANTIPTTST